MVGNKAKFLLHHNLDPHPEALDKEAIIDGDRRFSYRDLYAASLTCASVLAANGVRRGDRVAIFLPKSYEECWAIFGASMADGVFVPINSLMRAQQVHHIVKDSEARVLITDQRSWAGLAETLSDMETLDAVLLIDGRPEDEGVGGKVTEEAFDCDLLAKPVNASIGEDLAAILYTSGSTGNPKGVMLSHRNLLAGTRIVRTYLNIEAGDRLLSVLPFSFDYGLNQLLTVVEQNATLVLLSFRFGNEIVDILDKEKITGLAGVPTIWAILTRTPKLSKANLSKLRYITNSGGAVPTDTVTRLRELLPSTKIFLMYGLTEAFRSTYLDPEELDRHPTSIGKAIPECEIFAINTHGERCKPGEPGILVHRGPTVSMGYWRQPEETAQVLRTNPLKSPTDGGEIVCYSGDLVREDEDGFFYFVGRGDAMIKSSGYRISPTEVEEVLMSTGQFAQVAVIGLADPMIGQRVHAVATRSCQDRQSDDALAKCALELPAYMVPREIEFVDALPMSPNGKVDYKILAAERSST